MMYLFTLIFLLNVMYMYVQLLLLYVMFFKSDFVTAIDDDVNEILLIYLM